MFFTSPVSHLISAQQNFTVTEVPTECRETTNKQQLNLAYESISRVETAFVIIMGSRLQCKGLSFKYSKTIILIFQIMLVSPIIFEPFDVEIL